MSSWALGGRGDNRSTQWQTRPSTSAETFLHNHSLCQAIFRMHGFQGNERILKDAVRAVPANVLNAVLLPELRKNEEVEQFLDLEKSGNAPG